MGEISISSKISASTHEVYNPDDFETLKLLGKRTEVQVYQVRKRDTRRIYSMKIVAKNLLSMKELGRALRQRKLMKSPFVVDLSFAIQTNNDIRLFSGYQSRGELFWHLKKEGKFQEERAKFYIAEIILALEHFHEHGIILRSLRPGNILLDSFGHISIVDDGVFNQAAKNADTSTGTLGSTLISTAQYMAPEVLSKESALNHTVDFWSLGVLIFEMVCGRNPFYDKDTQQMHKNISVGKVVVPQDALSAEGRNFVKCLLDRDPEERLGQTANECKSHPFLSDINWQALAKKKIHPPSKPDVIADSEAGPVPDLEFGLLGLGGN